MHLSPTANLLALPNMVPEERHQLDNMGLPGRLIESLGSYFAVLFAKDVVPEAWEQPCDPVGLTLRTWESFSTHMEAVSLTLGLGPDRAII